MGIYIILPKPYIINHDLIYEQVGFSHNIGHYQTQ